MLVVDFDSSFSLYGTFHVVSFSISTLWGFLTAWWLDPKGEYPKRDRETQRERQES